MAGLPNGAALPTIELPRVGGGNLSIPGDLAGRWGVVLAYRGSWCPYCNAQLASFQENLENLRERDISVVAFSVDDEEHAQETATQHGLSFPVGFGADGPKTAELFEGYLNERRGSLEPMGFVLRPDSSIVVAVYSSGAIGRLVPEDVLSLVGRLQSRD